MHLVFTAAQVHTRNKTAATMLKGMIKKTKMKRNRRTPSGLSPNIPLKLS